MKKEPKNKRRTETVSIEIPNGVTIEVIDKKVLVSGSKGKIERTLLEYNVTITKEENQIVLSAKNATKEEKRAMNTFRAHLKNMIRGVQEGFVYKLKICYSHFPINVSISGDGVIIKNFLGEKTPRKSKILDGVKVEVNGDEVITSGINIEKVSQTAANLETATRITNRDRRVFLDGIYITEKAGVPIV